MTVEEFEKQLSNYGEKLTDINSELLDIAGDVVQDMKSKVPVDTGALRDSIQSSVEGNSIFLSWLYYGSFINYGVSGTQDSFGTTVPAEVEPTPENGKFYAFKERRFGIPKQTFFDFDDINNLFTDYILKLSTL